MPPRAVPLAAHSGARGGGRQCESGCCGPRRLAGPHAQQPRRAERACLEGQREEGCGVGRGDVAERHIRPRTGAHQGRRRRHLHRGALNGLPPRDAAGGRGARGGEQTLRCAARRRECKPARRTALRRADSSTKVTKVTNVVWFHTELSLSLSYVITTVVRHAVSNRLYTVCQCHRGIIEACECPIYHLSHIMRLKLMSLIEFMISVAMPSCTASESSWPW